MGVVRVVLALLTVGVTGLSVSGVAQPVFEANVSPNVVSVGERFMYELVGNYPSDYRLFSGSGVADFAPFVVADVQEDAPVESGQVRLRVRIRLLALETGDLMIATRNLVLVKDDIGANREIVSLPAIRVTVVSVLPTDNVALLAVQDAGMKARPLRSLQLDWGRYGLWVSGTLSMIALLALAGYRIWLARCRRQRVLALGPEGEESPGTRARRRLEELTLSGLIGQGRLTAYYGVLTDIIKEFLSAVFVVSLMEMTTSEVLDCLSGRVDEQTAKRIRNLFTEADLIKFARETPGTEVHRTQMDRALQIILRMEPVHAV